jgi:hypothetical protein
MAHPRKHHVKSKIGSPKPFHEEKAPPPKRRFLVSALIEITIEEHLLTDVLTDEWRQGRRLGSLDG